MTLSITSHAKPVAIITLLAASIVLTACGGGGGSSSSANQSNSTGSGNSGSTDNSGNGSNTSGDSTNTALQTNSNVAKNFVDNLAIPAYKEFASKSASLSSSIQSYCDAIGKSNEAATLTAAQSAWLKLKNNWQGAQLYAVGPVAENNGNLAKRIYTVNRFDSATQTFIKNEVAKLKANNSGELADSVVNSARGLDALEYLLYSTPTAADKKDNCNYAVVVAKDVKQGADAIVSAWNASTGRNKFLTPTTSNAVDLIQPFFENVANVADVEVKSAKVGIPAGLKADNACTTATCPELVEHSLSKTSYASIKANLESLKTLFNGKDGDGFKRYYTQKDMASQAQTFEQQIDDAIATIDAQSTSLHQLLTNIKTKNKANECATVAGTGSTTDADLAPCKLHYQVKKISDDIKTGSFKLAVNLTLPSAAAGDGD